MSSHLLRGPVNASAECLEALRAKRGAWIPGESSIRPNLETRQRKAFFFENEIPKYADIKDYVLHCIFRVPLQTSDEASEKLRVISAEDIPESLLPEEGILMPNMFPYDTRGRHDVIWYFSSPETTLEFTPEKVTRDVESALRMRLKHDRFDFVYYCNPKMSVPSIAHYQVFWRSFTKTEFAEYEQDMRPSLA